MDAANAGQARASILPACDALTYLTRYNQETNLVDNKPDSAQKGTLPFTTKRLQYSYLTSLLLDRKISLPSRLFTKMERKWAKSGSFVTSTPTLKAR